MAPAQAQSVVPLALRPRDAAKAIGVSPRTLWNLTAPRGPIPCRRIGNGERKTVLYVMGELEAWLASGSQVTETASESR